MPMLSPQTELEAVNEMLMSIGQAPVSTLAISGIQDVNIAKAVLARVQRFVLLYGFDFNTDAEYTLTPDIDGYLKVPEGVLRIDPHEKYSELIARTHPTEGRMIWNKADKSWEFTDPVDFKIVWGTPFDELPESAKAYVAIAAARKFQSQTIGSSALLAFTADDEQRAWSMLLRDDRGTRDTNMFRINPTLARAATNRRY